MTKALLSSDKKNGFVAGDSTRERSSTGMEVKVVVEVAGLVPPPTISQISVIVAILLPAIRKRFYFGVIKKYSEQWIFSAEREKKGLGDDDDSSFVVTPDIYHARFD